MLPVRVDSYHKRYSLKPGCDVARIVSDPQRHWKNLELTGIDVEQLVAESRESFL